MVPHPKIKFDRDFSSFLSYLEVNCVSCETSCRNWGQIMTYLIEQLNHVDQGNGIYGMASLENVLHMLFYSLCSFIML